MEEKDLIEMIKTHTLGKLKEAHYLYDELCKCLKEKYGSVDRDYDDNPTRRGKEWLDIHHILETELDDIANRTQRAINIKKRLSKQDHNFPLFVLRNRETFDSESRIIWEAVNDKGIKQCQFSLLEYTLDDLKPYNAKDKLVYANKLEHFLLHYLICSIRKRGIMSGGPNFLWDSCMALEFYQLKVKYMIELQKRREEFYSLISMKELAYLYRKLIDWEEWDYWDCVRFWQGYNAKRFYIMPDGDVHLSEYINQGWLLHIILYLQGRKTYEELEESYKFFEEKGFE